VIGRLVADALEGTLDPALVRKFAVDRVFDHGDLSRPPVPPLELTPDELCDAADLRLQVEL
jgi:sarcosine oxidase/L-pipecolate oxidase